MSLELNPEGTVHGVKIKNMVPLLFRCDGCGRKVSRKPMQTCDDCLRVDWSDFETHKERCMAHSIRKLNERLTKIESIIRVPENKPEYELLEDLPRSASR